MTTDPEGDPDELILYGYAGAGPITLTRYYDSGLIAHLGLGNKGVYLDREQASKLAGRLLEWARRGA